MYAALRFFIAVLIAMPLAMAAGLAAGHATKPEGISQVNSAVGRMDQVTQQDAAMVEESTAAAHSLAHETEALKELVAFFTVSEAARSELRVVARRRA